MATQIVAKIGTGTEDDPYRPDVPAGTSYRIVKDLGDSFEIEIINPEPSLKEQIEQLKKENEELKQRVANLEAQLNTTT